MRINLSYYLISVGSGQGQAHIIQKLKLKREGTIFRFSQESRFGELKTTRFQEEIRQEECDFWDPEILVFTVSRTSESAS